MARSQRRSKLAVSGQFLHCPLFLSIDTYEGCSLGCRYCFAASQYHRQHRTGHARAGIRPALLTSWERVLGGQPIGNPMIEYLVSRRHPIQLGTRSDPFPPGVEEECHNTRNFLQLCNAVEYPVYLSTKNTSSMPLDLLAQGSYVLGVSLISHSADDVRMLERHTSDPRTRLRPIPRGAFKKIILRWQPFIPGLFRPKTGRGLVDRSKIRRFLDAVSKFADGVSLGFLNRAGIGNQRLLDVLGPDDWDDAQSIEVSSYIREQAHLRGLEFYTSNYRALSDSPVCCGLRDDEFPVSTRWVWGCLIHKLFTGERPYLTVDDLRAAFPETLRDEKFATLDVPLFSRWARYSAKRTTILEEYIRNFTFDRRLNPANFFAGLYSKMVDSEYRIYFSDYRPLVGAPGASAG